MNLNAPLGPRATIINCQKRKMSNSRNDDEISKKKEKERWVLMQKNMERRVRQSEQGEHNTELGSRILSILNQITVRARKFQNSFRVRELLNNSTSL